MLGAIRSDATVQGIACMLGAMLALSLNDAIVKWISGGYALHEIVFVRSAVALAVTLTYVAFDGGVAVLRTRRPALHLVRSLLLLLMNMGFFAALATLTLAQTGALFFVAPLLITALSAPLLGERIGPWRWGAVLVGMAGMVVMLRPGTQAFEPAALLPVGAAAAYALMQILTRRLGATERASTMAFYIQLTLLAVSLLIGVAMGDGRFGGTGHPSLDFLLRAWTPPNAADLALMAVCGVLIGIVGILLSQAYRIAEATLMAPFEYAYLPLAVLWGVTVWGDWPDGTALAGIALIAGGGMVVFWRETVRGRVIAARDPLPRQR